MFNLSDQPLDEIALKKSLVNPAGGAVIIFDGVVRRQNNGRDVKLLEYEASEGLAKNEFEKIVGEVRQQFDFLDLRCVHRTGKLKPGDTAVWIGVASIHRSAAFAVCKYVIDELKKRLPIWKKEHYEDGDSGWINAP